MRQGININNKKLMVSKYGYGPLCNELLFCELFLGTKNVFGNFFLKYTLNSDLSNSRTFSCYFFFSSKFLKIFLHF